MKQLTISIFFFMLNTALYSQTQSNVYTPKGNVVTAYITSELSTSERAYWDGYFSSPNRNYIQYFNDGYSSSNRFNCHGYAWNMSEGGPDRWIGYYVTTDEDVYMTDGSYIQVCSEIYPGKVSWKDGDHSAITTATPGRWISKWNRYPLIEHDKDDTPFGNSYAYFASTKISGSSDPLCSGSRTYSVQNIPQATYTWIYSSSLTAVGPINLSYLDVQRNGNSTGSAWVEVQISTPCSSTTVTTHQDFAVGVPSTTCQQIGNGTCYQTNFLCPSQLEGWKYVVLFGTWGAGGTGYHLQTNGGGYFNNGLTTQDITTNSFSVYVPSGGNNVTVWAMNSCGVSQNAPYVIAYAPKSYGCYGGYYRVSPNPASSSATVSLNSSTADAAHSTFDQINIYDQQGNMKLTKKLGKVKTASVNINSLPNGIYMVEISNGAYKEKQQLIIQK